MIKGRVVDRLREILDDEINWIIPPHVNYLYYLGGITLLLFLVQVVTGVLLMIYYHPSTEEAYQSVRFIMSDARLGWLIRGVHKWGADLMMLTLLLHLLRVYFYGSYKPPRELNWVVGVFLLLGTWIFAFTGYLLVWDQRAFWVIDSFRRIIGDLPVLGGFFLRLLWGGTEVTEATLLRFYVFHVGILPWIMILFLFLHVLLIRRLGISEPLE
ncbi:MAG: cytochrome bc complex cytochrome b subunit [Candidatus Bipolaricaulia bacterium]